MIRARFPLVFIVPIAFAQAVQPVLTSPSGSVVFSREHGAITTVTPSGQTGSVWQSGEDGLWSARFADGSTLSASSFHATNALRAFTCAPVAGQDAWTFTYRAPEITVRVNAHARPDGIELTADLFPAKQLLLRFDLPGRLRFAPESVTRFIMPHNGNTGLGLALNHRFFEPQPEHRPSGWRAVTAGPSGYRRLYGDNLVQRKDHDAAVPITVTEEGKRWFSATTVARANQTAAVVNRPPTASQADLVLVDSPNGPYFSANRLGGTQGGLWRIGGGVQKEEAPTALALVTATVAKLAAVPGTPRTRIGLVSLVNGPERGAWCHVTVAEWRDRLTAIAARSRGRLTFTELTSPHAMLTAARASDYLCILNPYGESIPAPTDDGLPETLDALRAYVKAGGHWFEVGGHPFYHALRPTRFYNYTPSYPSAFADFMHLESTHGRASLYRVQPRTVTQPWAAAASHEAIFVPGELGCGGDARGGSCEHAFHTHVAPGTAWRTPTVRMTLGTPVYDDLARYAAANTLTRTLASKIAPETLSRLKQAPLLYLSGSCREKESALERLPMPTLIHFADYLKGGFDKEYPDHLPPHPSFGTADELRTFFSRARAMGHLISPYTNPTWWCDEPKGPTFAREGDAPLLKGLDGKPRHERYSDNTGWTTTLWHPAVKTANRRTVQQFTREFPVDILFQDQCGARRWHYDTNPASPCPYAYSEGMIAMNDEDSRVVPLGTENGWDRVANYQTLLSGLSWGIVPTEHGPTWVRLFKTTYPADTWEIFPLALALMHDKAIFLHHDLGQFVTNDRVLSWTLGLGYSLSYRATPEMLTRDEHAQWLAWLACLQRTVCARYLGEPLRAFKHDRAPLLATDGDPRRASDDGTLDATYGDVRLRCNLGDVPRTVAGAQLPAYGFRADAPGLTAGLAPDGTGYVTQRTDDRSELWLYGFPGAAVAIPVPFPNGVDLALDGTPAMRLKVADGALRLTLPQRGSPVRIQPPAERAARAPRDWPGAKPVIAVIDLGAGVSPALTSVTPAAWRAALEASDLIRKHGLTLRVLATYDELAAALAAGPERTFAIVNPYGEIFLSPGPDRWRETLDAVRAYVNHGGIWWETAAYSFHRAVFRRGEAWRTELTGPAGLRHLRLPITAGEVDQPPESLHATEIGNAWLGPELAARVAKSVSSVNRGVPSAPAAPATVLVAGIDDGFIGGYRLEGWGTLWRVGGFNPDPALTPAVAVAALVHQYTTPPEPLPLLGTRFLYHLNVER
jgi:hypothetical protein